MKTFSYSKISTYLQCPARYKFLYIDNYRKLEKPSPSLFVGGNIHSTLKKFFDLDESKRNNYENLEKLFRKIWRNNFDRKRVFKDKQEEEKYGKQALEMLRHFWNNDFLKKKPKFLEEEFKTEIAKNIIIKGKIDRIDEEEEGYHLIDYKTGKEKNIDSQNDLQLIFYSLLFYKQTSLTLKRASFFYLNSGKFVSQEISKDKLLAGEEKILKIIEAINSDGDFSPTPSNFCSYCGFLEICPSQKRNYRKNIKDCLESPPF